MTKDTINRKTVEEIANDLIFDHWGAVEGSLELEKAITAALQAERDRADQFERERDEALRLLEPMCELADVLDGYSQEKAAIIVNVPAFRAARDFREKMKAITNSPERESSPE